MKKTHITLFIFFLVFASSAVAQTKIDRFESAVAKFEQEDQEKGYQPEAVLFTGSSSIRMWKTLTEDMAPIPVINRGFGGSTIPEVLHYADRMILPHQPKYIVFYCGENDLSNDETKAKDALSNFKAFHRYLQENLPETRLYFIAIKPSISREKYWPKFQEANKMISKNKDVTSTHMNREGIYKWFIENFSKRTYRCPVKKTYRSAFDHETLAKLNLV
jgi:hypothetical protein